MVYCLQGNNSILVHTVLLFDAVVYVVYALTFNARWSKWLASLTLSANVFLVFLLSLMQVMGVTIDWTWQIGGLATGALIGSVDTIGNMLMLSDVALASMLIVSTQVSSSYVSPLLQSQYGLTTGASNTIALLFPLVVFYSVLWLVKCRPVRTFLRCVGLALLATAAYILYSVNISPDATVCCDTSGLCPIMPNTTDVFLFLALVLILIVAVLYDSTKNCMRWCRARCGPCCAFTCSVCGCRCGWCKDKKAADDEEEEEEEPGDEYSVEKDETSSLIEAGGTRQ